MSKAVMFRTSLAGYNKKDVNDYIRTRAEEMRAQMEEQKEAVAALSKQLSVCEEKAREEQRQFKVRLLEELSQLSGRLARSEEAVKELLNQLSLADRELQKGVADAEKAKKYDQLAKGLGQLLNLELKAEEAAAAELPDRAPLTEAVLGGLADVSRGLDELKTGLETEE